MRAHDVDGALLGAVGIVEQLRTRHAAHLPGLLLFNTHVEVESAGQEANDGQGKAHGVEVVDRCEDQLCETERQPADRDYLVLAFVSTALHFINYYLFA